MLLEDHDRGRPEPSGEDLSRHGFGSPRGQAPSAGGGAYGPLFKGMRPSVLDGAAAKALADVLSSDVDRSGPNPRIAAGYTYLGQFIDHDITFDTAPRRRCNGAQAKRVNFRTPRFDLDSLYAAGPTAHPFLYDWRTKTHPGARLLVGRNESTEFMVEDLPRNAQGRALIGDPRNDENLIIAQLHLLFIRFHNKVVDDLAAEHEDSVELFEKAQERVRWHYQWIVMHDLLPKIVGEETAFAVFDDRGDGEPIVTREFFKKRKPAYMPVEFSGAAFRFGHSMIRDEYTLSSTSGGVSVFRPHLWSGETLAGFRRIPAGLEIEWKNFFRLSETPQRSQLIDTRLAAELTQLPPDKARLARLNLESGIRLELPSGPMIASTIAPRIGATELSKSELSAALEQIVDKSAREALVDETPLWFYILLEAQLRSNGEHLGPIGGRIVAEVLTGLLQDDPDSYLSSPDRPWKPTLNAVEKGKFTMPDLIRFVEG